MKTSHQIYCDDTLKLYGLVTHVQQSHGAEHQLAQEALTEFLRGFPMERVIELRDSALALAESVLEGREVVAVQVHNHQQCSTILTEDQLHSMERKNLLSEKAEQLQSNMSKSDLVNVLNAYHRLEQPEIGFYGDGWRKDTPERKYFKFRGNVYAMKYPDGDHEHREKPIAIDFIATQEEFEAPVRKTVKRLSESPEPS